MYELIQAGANTYYLDCPAKIGIWHTERGVYLIDSGGDKDAGRKVRQVLDAQGWKLLGILNTHSHADHVGGNAYLQKQTGCKVFAGGVEGAFTAHPILEGVSLYGGYPCKELRHKFLLAQASSVSPLSDADFPAQLEVIPLPGHSFDMVGFRTPDNVVFLADCIASRATLEKYAVSFLWDAAAFLETLDRVEAMEADLFVPSHAPAASDVAGLVQFNRQKVWEVAEKILELCRTPCTFEQLLQRVFQDCGLSMNFQQHALVGSTVRSYLSWLHDTGKVEPLFEENLLLWRS